MEGGHRHKARRDCFEGVALLLKIEPKLYSKENTK
jgi:hypothetical protein